MHSILLGFLVINVANTFKVFIVVPLISIDRHSRACSSHLPNFHQRLSNVQKESGTVGKVSKRFAELVLNLRLRKQSSLLYPVLFYDSRFDLRIFLINWLDRSVYQVQLIIVKICAFMIYIEWLGLYFTVNHLNAVYLNVKTILSPRTVVPTA